MGFGGAERFFPKNVLGKGRHSILKIVQIFPTLTRMSVVG